MSLSFTRLSTDHVDHGSNASLDTLGAGVYMMWMFSGASADVDWQLFEKNESATKSALNPDFNWGAEIGRDSVDLLVRANIGNFASYGAAKWLFLAFAFDRTGADGDQKLLMGDLTTAATEPSTYSTQTVGSGNFVADASNSLIVGNQAAGNRGVEDSIASLHLCNVLLTNAQIRAQQFRFRKLLSSVILCEYGWNGTNLQPDWSGNGNNGTVTGATVSDHVPLGPLFGFDTSLTSTVAAVPVDLSWLSRMNPSRPQNIIIPSGWNPG